MHGIKCLITCGTYLCSILNVKAAGIYEYSLIWLIVLSRILNFHSSSASRSCGMLSVSPCENKEKRYAFSCPLYVTLGLRQHYNHCQVITFFLSYWALWREESNNLSLICCLPNDTGLLMHNKSHQVTLFLHWLLHVTWSQSLSHVMTPQRIPVNYPPWRTLVIKTSERSRVRE